MRRFNVRGWTFDKPRPWWMQLAPGYFLPAVVANGIAHALGSRSVAGAIVYAINFVLLLLAVVAAIAGLRWNRRHRIHDPSSQ